MAVVERKKGGGPSGNRAQSAVKRAKAIELRLAGHTLEQVAEVVGLTTEGVRYHEQAWLAERKPSAEVTEAQRQKQDALIDVLMAKLWPVLDDPDQRFWAHDRIVKLMDRKARLMGLDLAQPGGVSVSVSLTREGLADLLGLTAAPAQRAIEGVAEEITSDE